MEPYQDEPLLADAEAIAAEIVWSSESSDSEGESEDTVLAKANAPGDSGEKMDTSRQQRTDVDLPAVALDLVIKLGGAAITDKSSLETLQPEQLRQGAALVKLCHESGQKIAIVHGAGSFGHFQAKKYRLNEGLDMERNFQGFCETRNSVCKLNKHVVECLTDKGLPAVSCPAFPCWQTCGGTVVRWPREAVGGVLRAGLVPVFHGDAVLDTTQGCSVLSGDTIIQMLCQDFNVKRVVFLTDVSGVYNKPPSEEGAELLHLVRIKGQECGDVRLSTSAHDASGGMGKKLSSAHQIALSSGGHTRVFITKVGSPDALKVCLDNEVNTEELAATEVINQT